MNANLRNIVIVLVLAGLVALLPGGGTGASVALQAVSLAFLGALAWIASITYRQRRPSSTRWATGDGRPSTQPRPWRH